MMFVSLASSQSKINTLLDDFKKQGDNFNIELDGDFIKWSDEKTANFETKLNKIRLVVFEKGKCLDKSTYQNIKDVVRASKFEDLLYVRDGNEKVEAFAKEAGDFITDLFLLITTDDQSIILNVSGKIKLDELKELDMDMKGFDKLKKLGNRA
jgi:hypothetical protein